MAWLLACARSTRSDRELILVSWKWAGLALCCAALAAGGAYMSGWRMRALDAGPTSGAAPRSLPPMAAERSGEDRRSMLERGEASEAACHAALKKAEVSFRTIPKERAPGVVWPVELTSSVGGVLIHGGRKGAPTNYLDCRLALALIAWAPSLREQGVVGLEHWSAYRRDAIVATTNEPSGHALGMAIDIARFEMADGRELSVLEDWVNRARGADPCQPWPTDRDAGRIMRKLVCDAYEHGVFQSVVTPHANDAHHNHVHLEIRRPSDSAWLE